MNENKKQECDKITGAHRLREEAERLCQLMEPNDLVPCAMGVCLAFEQRGRRIEVQITPEDHIRLHFLTKDSIGVWHWDPDQGTHCFDVEEAAQLIRQYL